MLNQEIQLQQIRQNNLSRVLYTVWSEKHISRAQLARRLHLSRSAISSLVDELMESNIIHESHIGKSSGGRPPIVLQFAKDQYQIMGVDMGSSHIQVVSMSLDGTVQNEQLIDFDCQTQPRQAVLKIIELIEQVRLPGIPVLGIGVAAPCPVQEDQLSSRILPSWKDHCLKSHLEEHFALPVLLENDANLGALAEKWWGAGQDNDSFIFLKVATGVGAGIINHGKLVKGSNSFAGEVGHIPVSATYQCRCGMTGCLEAHIGSVSLARLKKTGEFQPSHPDIFSYFAHYLSQSIAIIINLLNPEKIILFCPHFEDSPEYFSSLRESMKGKNLWNPFVLDNIIPSPLQNEAISIGAATLVLEEVFQNPFYFIANQTTQ